MWDGRGVSCRPATLALTLSSMPMNGTRKLRPPPVVVSATRARVRSRADGDYRCGAYVGRVPGRSCRGRRPVLVSALGGAEILLALAASPASAGLAWQGAVRDHRTVAGTADTVAGQLACSSSAPFSPRRTWAYPDLNP